MLYYMLYLCYESKEYKFAFKVTPIEKVMIYTDEEINKKSEVH